MIRMILTRLISSLLTLTILITIVFFMAHATPGGPAFSILGQKATPQAVEQLNQRLGLTRIPSFPSFHPAASSH